MPDIFDEVEEDLRAERMHQLLTRYAGVILALALLAIGGVAGWQGWRWYEARQDQRAAQTYVTAMLAAEATGPSAASAHARADAAFKTLAHSAMPGYRTLARLRSAALDAADGHAAAALSLWNAVAADRDADPLLRGLASLLWASRQLDAGDPELLAARLRPLAVPGGAWRHLAEEDLALLDLRQHHTAQAKRRLTALAGDMTTPDGLRQRAKALLADLNG
ncbi:MAG: tetratricopeptide repeat protein [Acetobacteraceae bacterium]